MPVVKGSAREALTETIETDLGTESIKALMNIVDVYIKQPKRLLDGSFLLSIETTLVAKGRGTVVTGKVESGKININDSLCIVGSQIQETICLGLEMFRKSLDYAEVGDISVYYYVEYTKIASHEVIYYVHLIQLNHIHNLKQKYMFYLKKKEDDIKDLFQIISRNFFSNDECYRYCNIIRRNSNNDARRFSSYSNYFSYSSSYK